MKLWRIFRSKVRGLLDPEPYEAYCGCRFSLLGTSVRVFGGACTTY